MGISEILRANPKITNPKIIYARDTIILPTSHLMPDVRQEGIVINLAEPRLYFFAKDQDPSSFPISIGADEKTPLGKTKISAKRENPAWAPPPSIREENPDLPEIVPAGPDNPLGNHALYLDASRNRKWSRILIHGTNAPWTIGAKVSHGCIRMYPQDVAVLFAAVEIGTPVVVVNQKVKVSEINNEIYLELHLQETPELVTEDLGISNLICKKITDCQTRVDWQKVDEAVLRNSGILEKISR